MATITDSKPPEVHGQDCCAEKEKIFNASCEPVLTEDNDSRPKEIERNVRVKKIRGKKGEEYSRYKNQVKESECPDSTAEKEKNCPDSTAEKEKKENIFNASCKPDLIENKGSGSKVKDKNVKVSSYRREMNKEEYMTYRKQVHESQGFDVDRFEGTMIGLIVPVHIEWEYYQETLPSYCEEAIQVYNTNEKTNYKFQELVKANTQVRTGSMLFITFKARDPSEQTCVIFQARVLRMLNDKGIRVDLCRKKPTQ